MPKTSSIHSRNLAKYLTTLACVACLVTTHAAPPNTSTAMSPTVPPNVDTAGNNKPMMMLTASKDHTLFGPMYTDFEDLDGDGVLDVTFKPTFKYYGYFDATKCYTYSSNMFSPSGNASINGERYVCGGSGQWAGNFLNWASMTRLDIIRKMLYGGQRSTDSTTDTVLHVARLSRDSHSFVKYYNGTDIRDYTPFTTANLTKSTGTNANTYAGLTMCITGSAQDTGATSTAQIRLAKGNYRLWSVIEGTVCNFRDTDNYTTAFDFRSKLSRYYTSTQSYYGGGAVPHETKIPSANTDGATYSSIGPILNLKVKVCVDGQIGEERCQAYTNGSTTVYKPIGLLQKYGSAPSGTLPSSARAEFGLITGSYDLNLKAGALRKNIGDLSDEINRLTGQFCFSSGANCSGTLTDGSGRSYTSNGLIKALDSLILYGRESGNYVGNGYGTYPNSLTNGTFPAWGNPLGEMLTQALQYYAGLSSTNPTSTSNDSSVSMPIATWKDPLSYTINVTDNGTTVDWRKKNYGKGVCRPLNMLTISSSALSYDGDDAESAFATLPNRSRGTLSQFTDVIGVAENIQGTLRSIGNTSSGFGEECSAKTIPSLSAASGICPVAPALKGGYKIAGAALYGNTNKVSTASLPSDAPAHALKVKTYAAAMAGGVPRVEVPIPGTSPQKYVYITPESLFNHNGTQAMPGAVLTFSSISSSATHGTFVATVNDVQFGGDYDGDLAGFLRYDLIGGNQIKITTDIMAGMGGASATFGYSIIGTTKDGRYLTHDWLSPGNYFATRTPSSLCGYAGYKASTNLATVSLASNGVFPGIAAGAMGTGQSGVNACATASSNVNTDCGSWGVPGYLCVKNQDSPVSITFDMTGAASVTLEDPLWYAAKYGSFTPDSESSTEMPDASSKWDVESNNGVACSSSACPDGIPDGYFLARRPDLLEKRLDALFDKITSNSNAAPAVSSAQLSAGGYVYTATFSNDHRWGTVLAYKLKSDGSFETSPTWDGSKTLAQTPASYRQVITNIGTSGAVFTKSGLGGNAAAPYLALKSTGTETETDSLIDYIRGDTTHEKTPGSTELWRYRVQDTSLPVSSTTRYLMGAVINSSPWLQSIPAARQLPNFGAEPKYSTFVTAQRNRRDILWVGAADGMLHGFAASGTGLGAPVLSYVPSPLLGQLRSLSQPTPSTAKNAPPGMDGSPFTADVTVAGAWKTYLFSSLGRGGKAVFALDVTNTSSLNESNAASVFKWMFTSNDDADLGYVLGVAKIHPDSGQATPVVRMQNGKYAVLIPNGINSANGKAYLYILFVDGPTGGTWTAGTNYVKLATDNETGNGLMGVTWADTDRDGKADTLYATDLLGRLWKFNVSSSSPTSWTAVNGKPLMEAKSGASRLPVTTAPAISFPTSGGVMVGFGTGKAIFTGDFPNSSLPQRFYSVYDLGTTRYTTTNTPIPLSKMVKRTAKRVGNVTYIDIAAEVSGSVKVSTFNKALYDGWYIEFPPLSSSSSVTDEVVIGTPVIALGTLYFTTVRANSGTVDKCFGDTPLTAFWAVDPYVGTPKVNNLGTITVGGDPVNIISVDTGGIQNITPGLQLTGGKTIGVGWGVKPDGSGIQPFGDSNYSPSRSHWREIPNMRTLN